MSLLAQDEALTRKVGAATLAVVAAATAFVVFVAPRIDWTEKVRVDIAFEHTGGLREGAPIVIAGAPIGAIESVALAGNDGVVVTVAIDADAARTITRGGDVFVTSKGALGARYLELGPAPVAGPTLADDPSPLRGADPPSLDRVLQRTWDNLTIARDFADAIRPEMDTLRVALRELEATLETLSPNVAGGLALGVELRGLAAEARALRDVALGGDTGRDHLARIIADARATLAHGRRVLDALRPKLDALSASARALRARIGDRGPQAIAAVELAIARIRAAIDKVDPLLAKIEELQARIARGEGSLGKLMKDPEFPEDAKALGKILKRQPWKVFERPADGTR